MSVGARVQLGNIGGFFHSPPHVATENKTKDKRQCPNTKQWQGDIGWEVVHHHVSQVTWSHCQQINQQLIIKLKKKKIKRPVGHFAHQDNNSQINFILSSFFTKFNAILYKSESIFSKKKIEFTAFL